MAMGTPVVASAVGGIPEILDGCNGFAIENDADKMAEKIKYIVCNNSRKEEMSRHAVNTFEQSFTVRNMTNSYLKIYEQILMINK